MRLTDFMVSIDALRGRLPQRAQRTDYPFITNALGVSINPNATSWAIEVARATPMQLLAIDAALTIEEEKYARDRDFEARCRQEDERREQYRQDDLAAFGEAIQRAGRW